MNKTIKVRTETKTRLEDICKKTETFDTTISKLIDLYGMKIKKVTTNDYHFLQRFVKRLYVVCEKCNKRRALIIHHKDVDRTNNKSINLKCVCRKCHILIHYPKTKHI